ncbi:hypothetical protein [Paraburkholderia adhaesiva]|uniref:hypothetical protein n=1 Tax=Paraburkholderia adhaesiva TaxID=2883244 RepID=UPI001F32636C|nr:hypothetical protein [Paraburkholderia adhaesiva]
MNQKLRYALGVSALTGFVISLVVHVSALMGFNLAATIPSIWALHAGVFVVFAPFVFLCRKELGGKGNLWLLWKGVPNWVAVLGGMIFVYVVMNFLLFMLHTEGGMPAVQDGKYVLLNHGKFIRQLTPSEFTAFKANELRGFSGHWLLFYFVPAAYFLFWKSARAEPVRGRTGTVL